MPDNLEQPELGATPLHYAAAYGDKDLAEFWLAKGVAVNVKAQNGSTPLHHAAQQGHKNLVQLLRSKGADVNATRCLEAHTSQHWGATSNGSISNQMWRVSLLQFLMRSPSGSSFTCRHNYGKIVTMLCV